jgi:predicted aspartyl protease
MPHNAAANTAHTKVGRIIFWIFISCFATNTSAQPTTKLDLELLRPIKGGVEVPFDLENEFIVVNIYLDNYLPLRFIIDTGAEHSLILDKSLTDYLQVSYAREFDISGADMDSILTAYLATGVNFRVANSLMAKNRSILVLKENYFQFERITGTTIHGILGGDFLARFVVKFDYRRRMMILYEPRKYKAGPRLQQIPATFRRNRPFLQLPVSVDGMTTNERNLLLDTGAGLFLLLYTAENDSSDLPIRVIPTKIAQGIGGQINGNVGRAKRLRIGEQEFGDIITYFQNSPFKNQQDSISVFDAGRDGLIGNALLRRFTLVIDYVRDKVYVKPNRKWKRPTNFDRSGLQIAAGGRNLKVFLITDVLRGSPADEAGLKVGDRVKKLNGTPAAFLTLDGIIQKLERREGKRIKIVVKRPDGDLKVAFRLRDLI